MHELVDVAKSSWQLGDLIVLSRGVSSQDYRNVASFLHEKPLQNLVVAPLSFSFF